MKTCLSSLISFECIVLLFLIAPLAIAGSTELSSSGEGFRLTELQLVEMGEKAQHGDVCSMRALALHAGMHERDDALFIYWSARAADRGDVNSREVVIDRLRGSGSAGIDGVAQFLSEHWSTESARRFQCGPTALILD